MTSKIKGMPKLQKRLSTADFVAKPTGEFLRSWREDLKEEVLSRAPDWRGRIVNAIEANQDTAKFPLWARVFSQAPEARWSEFGTGILSDDPKSAHARYFPPPERLREWAEYYGYDPFTVARGIYERGGTPPTHFFRDAERSADSRFAAKLNRFGRNIEATAGREP